MTARKATTSRNRRTPLPSMLAAKPASTNGA